MYKYLITLLLSIISCSLSAQRRPFPPLFPRLPPLNRDSIKKIRQQLRDTTPPPTEALITVGFEPFYMINSCFKLDIAFKPANHMYGFELTPEVYFGPHWTNRAADNVAGFGIGLYHQFYFYSSNNHPLILSYGATYRNIKVSYSDVGFIPETKGGLEYYHYKEFDDVVRTNSVLVNINLAIRITNNHSPVFVDFYGGLGYKFASEKANYQGYRTLTGNMFGYAHQGAMVLVGFKFGPSYLSEK